MIIGGLGASWYSPMRAITSAKFSPAALTSTTTWPSPATGSGRSSTRSTEVSPCEVLTTARTYRTLGQQLRRCLLGAPVPEGPGQQRTGDEHRDDAGEQPADADPDRRPDAPQAGRVVVRDEAVVVDGLREQREEQDAADGRRDDARQRRAQPATERVAEVPRAGEPGQAVVEGDHEAERDDRVAEHVLGDDRQRDVEGDRGGAHADRRDVGREVARMDAADDARQGAVARHRQR